AARRGACRPSRRRRPGHDPPPGQRPVEEGDEPTLRPGLPAGDPQDVAALGQPAVDEPSGDVGVADLYRAVWAALRQDAVRQRLSLALELAVIAAWFLIRTRYDVETRPYLAWTLAT